MKNFKDKVVIVTGASSGIGEAMAREFAAQGARVVLGARSVQKLQLIAGEIRSQGGQAAYCGVDVTNVDECRRLIETAVNEFGGIDVLVCNAGLSMRAIFDDVDLGVLHRLMDVNFWGTVNCCKFALPYLQQSHGSIAVSYTHLDVYKRQEKNRRSLRGMLDQGIVDGLFVDNINIDLAISVLYYTASALVARKELMLPAGMTEREAFVQIISNFFRGISTAKGLRMIDDNLKRYELTKYDK